MIASPVEISETVTEDEWNSYVLSHPLGTVDHLWRWRRVFEEVFHHRSAYLAARRDGVIVGVLPLVLFGSRLFGRFVVSLPFLNYGGVLASDEAAIAALVEHAREVAQGFGASHVELRHGGRQLPDLPFRQHKLRLTRTLPSTSDELWALVDRKVRNQVRKAQKDGLTSAIGGDELVDQFYDVFTRNMRDLGTPVYPRQLFSETLRLFPDTAHVYVVHSGTVPVAAGVALRYRDTVLVPWASSLRAYRPQCPNMLLYWTMLEHAVTSGARAFDFGRSSADSGTHHFKLQWGAQATPLHWEYVLLTRKEAPDQGPHNPRFAAAISAWQKLPLWLTRMIGPTIVRNIP
jgi:FemAB-related protein (PEP-CTERM system-associated)